MKQPLTPRQQETYDQIACHLQRFGIAPTVRELMAFAGLKSPAPMQSRLHQLKDKGWIDWQAGKYRSIVLLRDNGVVTLELDAEELAALRSRLCDCQGVPALKRVFDRLNVSENDDLEDAA